MPKNSAKANCLSSKSRSGLGSILEITKTICVILASFGLLI